MSKSANPVVIGIFLVGALTLFVTAILTIGSNKFFVKSDKFVLLFNTSVNGLEVGAPVKFKGVQVGQVIDIQVLINTDQQAAYIPVIIEVDEGIIRNQSGKSFILSEKNLLNQKIQAGLTANLAFQSYVTGLLYIELDYDEYETSQTVLSGNFHYPQIPTLSNNLEEIWKLAIDTIAKVNSIDFVTIGNRIESLVSTLDTGFHEIEFKKINTSLIDTMASIRNITASEKIQNILSNTDQTVQSAKYFISNANQELDTLSHEIHPLFQEAHETLKTAQMTFSDIRSLFSSDSILSYRLDSALFEIQEAAQSIRVFMNYLERNPNALITGKHREPNAQNR